MTRLVEVGLSEGDSVLVEVEEYGDGPAVRGVRGGMPPAEKVEKSLDELLSGLGSATHAVLAQLRGLADSPHDIEVEFGIKISADANVIIARAASEASFRIVMRWSKDADSPNLTQTGVVPAREKLA